MAAPVRFTTMTDATLYERDRLDFGAMLVGPAIVEQYDATTVVCPEQTVRVDDFGNLVITGSRA